MNARSSYRLRRSTTILLIPLALVAHRAAAFSSYSHLHSLNPRCYRAGRHTSAAKLMMQSSPPSSSSSKSLADNHTSTPPLFIYGSLMSHKVIQALIGRVPICQPGVLKGYHRFSIMGRPYPAITAVKTSPQGDSASVRGLIVCGLTATENAILDYFEGTEYVKVEVLVDVCKTPHNVDHEEYISQTTNALDAESVRAVAYVYARQTRNLYGTWEVENFLSSNIMEDYIENARACGVECMGEIRKGRWPRA